MIKILDDGLGQLKAGNDSKVLFQGKKVKEEEKEEEKG